MIVDDDPDDRDLLSALVETALPTARLSMADNGFQALVAIGQRTPDILIADIAMPHMNGVEMLCQLATRCVVRPRHIFAMSSQSRSEFAPLGPLPEEVIFVAKPIEPQAFGQLLQDTVALADNLP